MTAICRRKKTRCPGERPACSTCTRLQQACQYSRSYESLDKSPSGDRATVREHPAAAQGPEAGWKEMTNSKQEDRLQQLEEKMQLMLEGNMCESLAISKMTIMLITAERIAKLQARGLTRANIIVARIHPILAMLMIHR